jgi:hypothetical protein
VRRSRRSLIAAGTLLMGYAVVGAIADEPNRLVGHALFLVAVLILHDGVLMPLAIGVGALIGRFVPARGRAVVRVAAYLSVILVVVALPFVLGFGRRPDDPSALPLNYGRGLAIALAAVWLGAAAVLLTRRSWPRGRLPRRSWPRGRASISDPRQRAHDRRESP